MHGDTGRRCDTWLYRGNRIPGCQWIQKVILCLFKFLFGYKLLRVHRVALTEMPKRIGRMDHQMKSGRT